MAQKQLILVFSGKKQAGKSTACKFVFSQVAKLMIGQDRFVLTEQGQLLDRFYDNQPVTVDRACPQAQSLWETFGCKVYSFADPLKDFVSSTFGIDLALLYGTDQEKNSKTHILWEDMAPHIRTQYAKPRKAGREHVLPTGHMTIREILQVFGTDICRKIDSNCWARALYAKIAKEGYRLALVADARFPNEIAMGSEVGAKSVRFTRNPHPDDTHPSETALDDFPLGEYSLVLDNSKKGIESTHAKLLQSLVAWGFNELYDDRPEFPS